MNSIEKYEAMYTLAKPKDRRDIPIYPMILTWCGTASGISQAEIVNQPQKWMEAMHKTFEIIGKPDVSISTPAGDVIFVMGIVSRIPGRELGDNELYQFVETPHMEPEDYPRIVKMGWTKWYNSYLMSIQKPPMKSNFQLILRYIKMGSNMGKYGKYLAKEGIAPIYHTACAPAFDNLSLVRSMAEFSCDLMDDPGPIMDACKCGTPEIIATTIQNVKRAKGDKAGIFPMRSCRPFISPDMFKEYSWPGLKQIIEALHKAGIKSVVHCDANWDSIMHHFTELPKGSVHLELDGVTDIFKAHAAVEGWQSVRGDVPASMLAFGTPDDVSAYCDKLVTELGMRGGFMLGSGCEVPLNAKVENVKAMMAAVR